MEIGVGRETGLSLFQLGTLWNHRTKKIKTGIMAVAVKVPEEMEIVVVMELKNRMKI
jgi:hypothetical protein